MVSMSGLAPQMLPPNVSLPLRGSSHSSTMSNGSLQTVLPPTSSAPGVGNQLQTAAMNGLHPNATFYPMQFFYYPTQPLSPSVYLQPSHMHQGPVTLVLRGKWAWWDVGTHTYYVSFCFQETMVNTNRSMYGTFCHPVVFRLNSSLHRPCSESFVFVFHLSMQLRLVTSRKRNPF